MEIFLRNLKDGGYNAGGISGGSGKEFVDCAYLSAICERAVQDKEGAEIEGCRAIEDIEELYTLINQNLTEADGWILEEGEKLPTINFEEE